MIVSRCVTAYLVISWSLQVLSLSLPSGNPRNRGNGDAIQDGESSNRRDLLLYAPIGLGGAVLYGKLLSGAIDKLSRGALAYPVEHEQRVEDMISQAILAGIPSDPSSRALRVLEVGIGKDCRLIRRGLYDRSLERLRPSGVSKLELKAVDISVPAQSVQEAARERLKEVGSKNGVDVDFDFVPSSISTRLDFPDGWFDAVLCSLVLCSVDDEVAAIQEIKRLVRPNGGTFGYVEHVAVKPDEPYRLLAFQQQAFDPLQQLLAENCHLHRGTDGLIAEIFEVDGSGTSQTSSVYGERFLVDGMWPVSLQASGVIQRNI